MSAAYPTPTHVPVVIHAERPLPERVVEGRQTFEEENIGGKSWSGSICDKRVCGTKRQAKGNKWSQKGFQNGAKTVPFWQCDQEPDFEGRLIQNH